MNKRFQILGLGFFIFSILFSNQVCWGGLVIEELHRDIEGRMERVIRSFSQDRFRTDYPEGHVSTIIDFKEDRMVMIDHSSRNYVEIKFSQWEKEVAAKLKQSAPGYKTKTRKITVKSTGEKAMINGFQTEKVEIWADEELVEENWMTRDVDLREVEKVMEKIARSFSKEFKIEMKEGRQIYDQLKSYGIPILVKDYMISYGLAPVTVMEVRTIVEKDLGEEVFSPPSGYQRILPEVLKK